MFFQSSRVCVMESPAARLCLRAPSCTNITSCGCGFDFGARRTSVDLQLRTDKEAVCCTGDVLNTLTPEAVRSPGQAPKPHYVPPEATLSSVAAAPALEDVLPEVAQAPPLGEVRLVGCATESLGVLSGGGSPCYLRGRVDAAVQEMILLVNMQIRPMLSFRSRRLQKCVSLLVRRRT